MREISFRRSFLSPSSLLLFSASISPRFTSGISDDSSGFKNGTKVDARGTSGSSTASKVALLFLVVVALGLCSFFLYKFWQKKKRDEQYARLLKLFEKDDELEVELGLQD